MSKRKIIIPEIQEIARKVVEKKLSDRRKETKKTVIKDQNLDKLDKFKFLCGGYDDSD